MEADVGIGIAPVRTSFRPGNAWTTIVERYPRTIRYAVGDLCVPPPRDIRLPEGAYTDGPRRVARRTGDGASPIRTPRIRHRLPRRGIWNTADHLPPRDTYLGVSVQERVRSSLEGDCSGPARLRVYDSRHFRGIRPLDPGSGTVPARFPRRDGTGLGSAGRTRHRGRRRPPSGDQHR